MRVIDSHGWPFLGSVPASIHGFVCEVWVGRPKTAIRDIVVQGDELNELEEVKIL